MLLLGVEPLILFGYSRDELLLQIQRQRQCQRLQGRGPRDPL